MVRNPIHKMKDLKCLTVEELKNFFDSFDLVLCDVDGVLWNFLQSIQGSEKGAKSLQQIGKKVVFLSNNNTKTLEVYHEQLKTAGFKVDQDELITPILVMINYLKKIKFDKEIYLITVSAVAKQLEAAGFRIAERKPELIKESLQDFVAETRMENSKIGAVIADSDINLNYVKLQRAVELLKDPAVVFLAGASDRRVPLGLNNVFLGPGYFIRLLEDAAGRQACHMAKPSPLVNDYIVEKLKITDPSRVLFVGDSVLEDMSFATKFGYKKLLVFTGLTKREQVTNKWEFPEEYRPDFYVDALKDLHELIEKRLKENRV